MYTFETYVEAYNSPPSYRRVSVSHPEVDWEKNVSNDDSVEESWLFPNTDRLWGVKLTQL